MHMCLSVCIYIHAFFISKVRLNLAKNQANVKQHLRLNFSYLIIIQILDPRYHPKLMRHILKNKPKSKRVFIHKITRLIIMKMKMKIKNRSHKYGINRHWSRHGHKYNKNKTYLSMTMLLCITQQLSNI